MYAAILAQACNFGLTTMTNIADLTYRQLAWTTDWYLREETLKAAFSRLSWTSTTRCLLPRPGAVEASPPPMASDSPFEARRRTRPRSRNISASGRGLTFYTWTSDQYSQYGSKVISSTVRDATGTSIPTVSTDSRSRVERQVSDPSQVAFALIVMHS